MFTDVTFIVRALHSSFRIDYICLYFYIIQFSLVIRFSNLQKKVKFSLCRINYKRKTCGGAEV
jgi:hypothetical protein